MNQAKITKPQFLTLLEKHKGLVTFAIKEAGIARQTYYNWLENDEDFREKVDMINESVTDWVESKLYETCEQLVPANIQFYLKAKGKKRGYGDSITVDGSITHKGGIQVIFGGTKIDEDTNDKA